MGVLLLPLQVPMPPLLLQQQQQLHPGLGSPVHHLSQHPPRTGWDYSVPAAAAAADKDFDARFADDGLLLPGLQDECCCCCCRRGH
jgi:hypothetical protein